MPDSYKVKYCQNIGDLSLENKLTAGAKATSISELLKINISVPNGFVVLSKAFEDYLASNHISQDLNNILSKINYNNSKSVNKASKKIKNLILSGKIENEIVDDIFLNAEYLNTNYFAVRSSASMEDGKIHAWAGQLDSYLGISKINLLESIKECWASLFNSGTLLYRLTTGNSNAHMSTAVIVQEMVKPNVTGVAFSMNPVSQDLNKIVIEASEGKKNSVVSGEVIPIRYELAKDNNETSLDSFVDKYELLSQDEINLIKHIVVKIERHFSYPVDVEWGIDNDRCYIFQSRPITTFSESFSLTENDKFNFTTKWIKHWSGKWSILISSLLSYQYTRALKNDLGVSFNNVLFSSKEGITDCYLNESEYKHFGNYLSKKVIQNPDIAKTWSKDLISKTDDFLNLISNFNFNNFSIEKYKLFLKKFYQYGIPHRAIKIVVDFLPPRLLNDLLDELNYARKYSEPVYREADDFLRKLAELMAHKYKTTQNNVLSLLKNEFENLIEKGNKLNNDELLKRYHSSIAVYKSNNQDIINGQLANKIRSEIFFKLNNVTTIKGTSAFPGKVSGKVKIIFDPEKSDNFNSGDILVAGMTRPEFTHLIRKSSAIITDAGGILSHAAITARELKKPCIVGAKIATTSLKDNDSIIVNANNGTIKILNS